jgi:hypothetical protein
MGAAEFFERKLFVEVAAGGNALEEIARPAPVAATASGLLERLDRARFPVQPGGLLLLRLAHGVDRFAHGHPLTRAHAGAGLPGQVLVVHEAVFAVGEVGQRLGLQFLCGAFADHAPDPAALFLGELGFPARAVHFEGRSRGGRWRPDARWASVTSFLGAGPGWR